MRTPNVRSGGWDLSPQESEATVLPTEPKSINGQIKTKCVSTADPPCRPLLLTDLVDEAGTAHSLFHMLLVGAQHALNAVDQLLYLWCQAARGVLQEAGHQLLGVLVALVVNHRAGAGLPVAHPPAERHRCSLCPAVCLRGGLTAQHCGEKVARRQQGSTRPYDTPRRTCVRAFVHTRQSPQQTSRKLR